MPSNLPSSFASAAAGQNASRDMRGGRGGDGRGAAVGEWLRRDGRSTNGTLTLRRSSTTPLGQPSSQPPLPTSIDHAVQPPAAVETPMAQPVAYETGPAKYTREDLLELYGGAQTAQADASRLFIPGWNPGQINGSIQRGWGKVNDNHVPQEPGACWDDAGEIAPMGLMGMSLEEREAFSTEINSPLKPPTLNKEAHQPGANGRKASLSQAAGNTFGVSSPSSATRPGTRRRETLESNPFSAGALASPTASSRFSNRDDPNYWFRGKNTDLKETDPDDSDTESAPRDASSKLPFGNLVRSNTGGMTGMSAIWPPSNQTTPGGGAFGNFALPTPVVGEKRAGAGGGSRLAHLIPKDSSENIAAKASETANPLSQQSWRSRPRTDTDPFGEDTLSGSAILGGAQETGSAGISQPSRAGTFSTPVKGSTGDFGMSGLNLGDGNGPISPSETNPYRSPPAERHDQDENDPSGVEKSHITNPLDQPSNFGSISRGFGGVPFDGSDRSQTSSVGAKPYPSLAGLSGGWPASAGPSVGTPDRERHNFGTAFGSSLFNPMGELQSPGLSSLNNVFGPASAGGIGTGSISRGSKLGSLFPPAMQAQMQSHEQDNAAEALGDIRQNNPLGAIGRGNFGMPTRDTESPMRSSRGVFEELFPSSDASRSHNVFSTADAGHPSTTATAPQSFTPVSGGLPFSATPAGAESSGQVRQMVMPDRMRWVYLDPQGQVQGPFTGLEMNDWYKANFFTPDLRVKKVEDQDFEPLGQLIRRIGNSREPFLVPQIGIPHGPPSQSGPFSTTGTSGIIPPLSGVFPSFGRTLTAEEQNNLERRKQEEQYLMVQQREFVMRQQAMSKFAMQGPSLQHHSSAHSLQSQPSFGSMTSPNPIGMPSQTQPQPIGAMPPATGFFDSQGVPQNAQGVMGNGEFREEELVNLTNAERQVLASMQAPPTTAAPQPIGAPAATDPSLRTGLPETEELQKDSEGFRDRLMEFEDLRAQHDAQLAAEAEEASEDEEPQERLSPIAPGPVEQPVQPQTSAKAARAAKKKAAEEAALSLTQQVQKAQAAAAVIQSVETGMPMPFPPPPASTGTPLPAPTAQRARSNLPEQYSRSQSGTPDTSASANAQPPPLAPWAKDPGAEAHKGPSLKEIQEAEARKAAKAEEIAAAIRKAALEQEALALREREKAAAVTSAGLPATSTWGHGSPAGAGSPWVKPGSSKGATPGSSSSATTGSKKTLAEIQREEELRKQKAKDAIIQSGAPVNVSKSYANLAGKPGAGLSGIPPSAAGAAGAAGATSGGGWSTVGAGGKVKIPTGTSTPGRSVSTAAVKSVSSPVKTVSRPILSSANGKPEGSVAMEEFNKWVYRELSRGITSVDDISIFQSTLDVLPLDIGIISDAVYANSTTMDGRHFAEEYIRRKKLAERGIVEKQPADNKLASSGGGWSEVAKKGSASSSQPRDPDANMQAAGFKVVPGRKKGKK